jgi:prepilin-type N-terminal cleavage/methylation domain-containing protein/prepilin-type processing-associated H-X9-DG protein
MRRVKDGLTLIEVLVVCAVLAILAGLLSPVFAATRDRGKRTTCASNLHQLGMAYVLWGSDNGAYPDSGLFGCNPEGSWVAVPREYTIEVERGVLWPYVRDARIYRCPTYAGAAAGERLSYAMNALLALIPESAVAAPAVTPLLIEEDARSARGQGPNDGAWIGLSSAGFDRLATYHAGGGQVLYCDGHVGWRTGEVDADSSR